MPFGTGTVVTNAGMATAAKRLLGATPTQLEPKYMGIGTGATAAARTAAKADTALSAEVETRSGANLGTSLTTTQAGDSAQWVQTIVATAPRSVDEAGWFDQLAVGGNMFVSATFAAIPLGVSDGLQLTMKYQQI